MTNFDWVIQSCNWFIRLLPAVFHILTQFSTAITYNMFVTLGLITSVPVSAGKLIQAYQSLVEFVTTFLSFSALDILLYNASFAGMKLAGVILISIGFFLVMFPNNWPDYITRSLRWDWPINILCFEFHRIAFGMDHDNFERKKKLFFGKCLESQEFFLHILYSYSINSSFLWSNTSPVSDYLDTFEFCFAWVK